MEFGTWGNVAVADPILGADPGDIQGLRIPVRNLWQVDRIEFDPPELQFARPIFFDDPTLVGAPEEGFRLENWTRDILAGNTLVVHYRGGPGTTPPAPRRFSFEDFALHHEQISTPGDWGVWARPTIAFLTNERPGAPDGQDRRHCATIDPDDPESGWTAWVAARANQRLTIRYRSAPPITVHVPIFNVLTSIEVTSAEPVIMNGFGAVDHRRDTQREFLDRVVITGTYTLNLDGSTTTRDILAALAAGTKRGRVSEAVEAESTGTPMDGGTTLDPLTRSRAVATSVHLNGTADSRDMNPAIFTTSNSNAFLNAGTTRNIRVEVQPQLLGGVQRATRSVNFPIGLINWVYPVN